MTKVKNLQKSSVNKKLNDMKKKVVQLITVDEKAGLIFEDEEALFRYFNPYIEKMESQYVSLKKADDFSEEELAMYSHWLDEALENPDEIYMDDQTFSDLPVFHFIKLIEETEVTFRYVATAYMSLEENHPTFVFTHFATRDLDLVNAFRKGDVVFDEIIEKAQGGAIEGDGLSEGDPLAAGLYLSMMKLRGEKDFLESKFSEFSSLREETIENPDEIWKKVDSLGNILVTFIKEFPDHNEGEVTYVVVTQEDEGSNIHSLLYSFPSNDHSLVDRYRHGENLQAEEISQESAH